MKILGQFSPKAAPLALAVSLVLFSGNLRAFGPGGAGNPGGANGSGSTSGSFAAGGGSRGGGLTVGNPGGLSTGPAVTGTRSGVTFSNNAARANVDASTRGAGTRGPAPSSLSLPYRNVQNGPSPVVAARPATSQAVTRPNNAWSGTAVNPTSVATARGTLLSSNNLNGRAATRSTGQVLYPGTYGSNLPTTTNNNWTDRGNRNDGRRSSRPYYRLPGRYSYYPYAYGPAYAPYISYYGNGGYPYYGGAYPYYNDITTNEADLGAGPGSNSPQYVYQDQNTDTDPQPELARQQQPAPVPQSRNGNNATQGTIPSNGPDSLVEAVQEELIRRGYFGGKVDAMFNPETKEALRKFQADRHLAETGLINEATLHALQLD